MGDKSSMHRLLTTWHPLHGIPVASLRAAGVSSLPVRTIDVCGGHHSMVSLPGILEKASSTLTTLNVDCYSFDMLRNFDPYLHGLRRICLTRCRFGPV
ncbi:hypothetical protein VTI74DRAFT_1164 [Chaetomium olivicolor]